MHQATSQGAWMESLCILQHLEVSNKGYNRRRDARVTYTQNAALACPSPYCNRSDMTFSVAAVCGILRSRLCVTRWRMYVSPKILTIEVTIILSGLTSLSACFAHGAVC